MQAVARCVMTDGMLRIQKRYPCVLTVHDEVVAVVPDEDAANCMNMMMDFMKQAPSWCADLPVACEADIGKSYGDAK